MTGRGFWILAVAAVLAASCGLETVETLAPPDVDFQSSLQSTLKLTMIHHSAPYAGSVFQGYYVYYKVYSTLGQGYARLQSDRDTLASSPTKERLISMGYTQFSMSKENTDYPLDIQDLFFRDLSDGDKMNLDFTDFLDRGQASSKPMPVAKVNDRPIDRPNVYRSTLLSAGHRSFWNLPSSGAPPGDSDVFVWGGTADVANPGQEIEVFLVAYGMTATIQAVYSKPIPWGYIQRPPTQ